MIWTMLSVCLCLVLVVKLVFFTDLERRRSRWFYRFTLFLTAVYAGDQVITGLYSFHEPVHPLIVLLQAGLLAGSFLLRSHHLPWNTPHARNSLPEARIYPADPGPRLW